MVDIPIGRIGARVQLLVVRVVNIDQESVQVLPRNLVVLTAVVLVVLQTPKLVYRSLVLQNVSTDAGPYITQNSRRGSTYLKAKNKIK